MSRNGERRIDETRDIAWAAGLFDGEGSISVRRIKGVASKAETFQLAVQLAMTHRATVYKFKTVLVVGSVHTYRYGRYKRQWAYVATGPSAVRVLEVLGPNLVTKRQEAQIAINYPLGVKGKRVTQVTRSRREKKDSRLPA